VPRDEAGTPFAAYPSVSGTYYMLIPRYT